MRIYNSKIPALVSEIVQTLVERELIEVIPTSQSEVELDVESVLREYVRAERALTEEAKDMAEKRGLDYSAHQKIKRKLAERRRFGLYEDAIGYIANQCIETLLHTQHVEEVFAEDSELRSAIAPVIRKQLRGQDELDQEVRRQIRNLEEGTVDWDVRYRQTMERLQAARGDLN